MTYHTGSEFSSIAICTICSALLKPFNIGGSKMPRTDEKQMQVYAIPLPPPGLLNNFDGVVQPIISQLKTLSFANQKFRAARDMLLPRLMTGEFTV